MQSVFTSDVQMGLNFFNIGDSALHLKIGRSEVCKHINNAECTSEVTYQKTEDLQNRD